MTQAIDDLIGRLRLARAKVETGEVLDLRGFERNVSELCAAARRGADPVDAKRLQDVLEALQALTDAVAGEKAKLEARLMSSSDRRKATAAYAPPRGAR